jgi:hypothetical protein
MNGDGELSNIKVTAKNIVSRGGKVYADVVDDYHMREGSPRHHAAVFQIGHEEESPTQPAGIQLQNTAAMTLATMILSSVVNG